MTTSNIPQVGECVMDMSNRLDVTTSTLSSVNMGNIRQEVFWDLERTIMRHASRCGIAAENG